MIRLLHVSVILTDAIFDICQMWCAAFPSELSCALVSHSALYVLGIASVHLYSVCCPLKRGPAAAGSVWSLDCNLLTLAVNASKSHLCFFL